MTKCQKYVFESYVSSFENSQIFSDPKFQQCFQHKTWEKMVELFFNDFPKPQRIYNNNRQCFQSLDSFEKALNNIIFTKTLAECFHQKIQNMFNSSWLIDMIKKLFFFKFSVIVESLFKSFEKSQTDFGHQLVLHTSTLDTKIPSLEHRPTLEISSKCDVLITL